MMKKIYLLLFLLLMLAFQVEAQTYLSQSSHKQGAENSISITSNSGAQTGIDTLGYSSLMLTISGTYGSVAFKVEGSTDGTNYTHTPLPMFRVSDGQKVTTTGTISNTVEQYSVDVRGYKKVRVNVTAWTSGTATITQTPISASFNPYVIVSQPTMANLNATVNMSQLNGTTTDTNSGNKSAGTLRVVIATDQPQLTNKLLVTPDANSSVNLNQLAGNTLSSGNGASGTGTLRVSVASDSTGIIQPVPGTAGGLLISATQAGASTNATNVKNAAGQVYQIYAVNTTSTIYYLRLYNLSTSPTCSSATGFVATYPVPASSTGAGFMLDTTQGIAFGTGIGFCITGGASSTDNTNAATGVFVNILYK